MGCRGFKITELTLASGNKSWRVALSRVIPNRTKETARQVVRRFVEDIERRLAEPLRQAVRGALARTVRNRRPRLREIDWHRAIRSNLKNYQKDRGTIVAETLIGYPRTLGAELARKALVAQKRLIELTADRICSLYLTPGDHSEPEAAIFALAGHRFPESFAILAGRLKTAKGWEANRLIPALGILGDKAAIPTLRKIVEDSDDDANSIHSRLRQRH